MNIQFVRNIFISFLLLILPSAGLGNELSTQSEKESEQKSVIKPQRKPVFIEADRITGYYKQEIEATGASNPVLRLPL